MARTRGVRFVGARRFVSARFGPGAWNDVLASLEAADRDELSGLKTVGSYDLGLFVRLVRAVDARFGAGDLALAEALGRHEAERQVTTAKKWVLRLMPVTFALERLGRNWDRWHDTGAWTIQLGQGNASLRLDDLGVVDAALCRELQGYISRTLELLDAHDVLVEHVRCRARGDDTCEFSARWSSR